jgi:hypothetical protein
MRTDPIVGVFRVLFRFVLIACLTLLPAGLGWSQIQNASVSGRITDPSGAVVPNVHLTAQNKATAIKYSTTSNSAGYYTFPTIPIGTYTVTVDANGFKKIVRSNITLEVGQSARVDFKLQLGSPVQTVQVTSATPLLQTQSAMPQTAIRNRLVSNLPLSTRNWDDLISRELALTAPGGDNGSRRTILCGDDPAFVLYRVAQRFCLPVVPQWADWFMEELQGRKAIAPLTGLGCSPVVVKGTGKAFLDWIGKAVKRRAIRLPDTKQPIRWPSFDGILGRKSTGQTADSCN